MVRIVHFSDWHGQWFNLPEADLYICTGDMTYNHGPAFVGDEVVYVIQQELQERELNKTGSLRKFLGSSDAPVVVVRGNHDYVDFAPFFGGECFEITEDPTRFIEYCGFRIGGFRGVPPVWKWNDLLGPQQMQQRLESLPEVDILVTHGPPKHILADIFGSKEYLEWLHAKHTYRDWLPKLCCFGHIHEVGGHKANHFGVLFSNASLKYNIIDLQ
jgi:Icc-related predicted phosphoesterase